MTQGFPTAQPGAQPLDAPPPKKTCTTSPRDGAHLRASLLAREGDGALEPEQVLENAPLAPLTSLRVGGPARLLVHARSANQVRAALTWARQEHVPWLVLGGGSNVVVSDEGFPGLVLQPRLQGVTVAESAAGGVVRVAAGEEWDGFVATCVERGWAGVECLAGIPGHVGATPVQNVGAYGQEVADCILAVRAYDTREDRFIEFPASECGFAYRHSRFKAEAPRRHVLLEVTFRLRAGGSPTIRYRELEKMLESRLAGAEPSLGDVRDAVLDLRRRKSMIVDEADPDSRSAGSFFVNPVLDMAAFEALAARARALGHLEAHETPPHFPAGPDRVKLSAAWLIERSGFPRGSSEGPVGLSRHHALAVVNRGGATAREVLAFASRIRAAVRSGFGVELTPEPVLVGPSS